MKICSDVTKNAITLLIRTDELESVIDSRWIELIKGDISPEDGFEISKGKEFVKVSLFGDNYLLISNYFRTLEANAALEYLTEYISFVTEDKHSEEYILGFNNIFFDGEKLKFIKSLVPFEQSIKESIKFFIDGMSNTVKDFNPETKNALLDACEADDNNFEKLVNLINELTGKQSDAPEKLPENAITTSFDELDTVVLNEEQLDHIEPIESVIYERPIQPEPEPIPEPEQEDNGSDMNEQPIQKKVCPSCGAEYENDYVFCIKCGATLVGVEIADEPEAPEVVQAPEQSDEAKPQEIVSENEGENTEMPSEEETPSEISASSAENEPVAQEVEDPQPEETPQPEVKPQPETKASAVPVAASETAAKPAANSATWGKMYGETTLLGFTNYGETSILGAGAGGIGTFDTPNLIREMTGEKVFVTKRNFIIGKSNERADYTVKNNNAISRVHAEITVVGDEYYIIDKGSTNHTYVNNSMIQPESSVRIYDGDEIKLANEKFTFHLQ